MIFIGMIFFPKDLNWSYEKYLVIGKMDESDNEVDFYCNLQLLGSFVAVMFFAYSCKCLVFNSSTAAFSVGCDYL